MTKITKVSQLFAGRPPQYDPDKMMLKAMEYANNAVQAAAAQQRKLFAERLKTLRENAGLTQYQLADKAGLDRTLITRYETGKTMPRKKAIEKLAAALDVYPSLLDINSSDSVFFDTALLRRQGVNVRQIQSGLYALSLPGCHEVTISAYDLNNLWEECGEATMKEFTAVLVNHSVNLLIRTLYERNAADQNGSDTPAE